MEKVITFMGNLLIAADFILIFTECAKNEDFFRKCLPYVTSDTKHVQLCKYSFKRCCVTASINS